MIVLYVLAVLVGWLGAAFCIAKASWDRDFVAFALALAFVLLLIYGGAACDREVRALVIR